MPVKTPQHLPLIKHTAQARKHAQNGAHGATMPHGAKSTHAITARAWDMV